MSCWGRMNESRRGRGRGRAPEARTLACQIKLTRIKTHIFETSQTWLICFQHIHRLIGSERRNHGAEIHWSLRQTGNPFREYKSRCRWREREQTEKGRRLKIPQNRTLLLTTAFLDSRVSYLRNKYDPRINTLEKPYNWKIKHYCWKI